MRTPELKEYMINHYKGDNRDTATMMLGEPGIGKSVAVKEAAQEIADDIGLPFVDYTDQKGKEILESGEDAFIFHNLPLVECEPSDLVGIPREDDNDHVQFKPILWSRLMAEHPGILLLDDFLDVQRPDLFSAGYKITLERRAGYIKLDDGVMVVGASNTPEQSSLSQMIPAPLANRMIVVEAARPTIKEWSYWMNETHGDDWDKTALSFLKRFEAENYLLKRPDQSEVLHNFPTPRSWTKAALELEETQNPEVIEGLLGPEVGQKLSAFMEVNIDVDDLVNNPQKWGEQSIDAKFMLCTELSSWFGQADEPRKAFPLLDEMLDESRQFPILVFLSMNTNRLKDLFSELFKEDERYSELVSQAVRDKSKI